MLTFDDSCGLQNVNDPTSGRCKCVGNAGDYGCQLDMPNITQSGQSIQFSLKPQGWQYYRVVVSGGTLHPISMQALARQRPVVYCVAATACSAYNLNHAGIAVVHGS